MSIFDQIKKQISDVGSNAIDATKSLAEIQKLNNEINSSNKTIEKIYKEIGELYFIAHRDDPSCEYSDKIQEINDLAVRMEDLQGQIDRIKSEREAAKAAGKTAEDAEVTETSSKRFCSQCGAQVPFESVFCIKCGSKLEIPEVVAGEIAEDSDDISDEARAEAIEEAYNEVVTEDADEPSEKADEETAAIPEEAAAEEI